MLASENRATRTRDRRVTRSTETEEAGSEVNEREIEQVGEVDVDGQIEKESGGRRCDQTRHLITPGAPIRSHPSRRRLGRFPV